MPFFKGIHFQTYGLPAKPAIVFLHGFMGSAKDWNEVTAKLSPNYFCIAIDLPGHGESIVLDELDDVWGFEKVSQRLYQLITHLGIQKFSLVGYSMGGRISFHFALNYQESLSKLIIESSSPGIKKKSERQQRLIDDKRLTDRIKNLPFDQFLSVWYGLPVFKGLKEHAHYKEMIDRRLENDPGLLSRALITFSTGQQSYLQKKLSSLKIPVCLVCGERDTKYLDIFSGIRSNNPHFTLNVMKNCSHNTHFEKPVQFAEDLKQFLSL